MSPSPYRRSKLIYALPSLLGATLSIATKPTLAQSTSAELITQANGAVQKSDMKALRALGEKTASLAWLDHSARPGDTKWVVHLLKTPVAKSGEIAVFSAYHSCQSIGDHFHKLVKSGTGYKFGEEIPEFETLGFRVRDHKFVVTYDVPGQKVHFTDEAQIERTSATAGDLCLLRLSSNCLVSAATCSEPGYSAVHVPGAIAIKSPAAKKFTVKLAYVGDFNDKDMDSYVHPNEAILNAYWYTHIGRLPARSTVTVTTPKGWTPVGQGELIKQTEVDGMKTATFRNEIPVSYFSLDSGAYTMTDKTVNGVKITVYKVTPNEQDAQAAIAECARAMEIFQKSYHKFPYTRYGLVQTRGPFNGALEAYSFATFSGPRFGAVTHELSHTWFGGMLSNPYTHSMWNESFANYADGFCRREIRGDMGPALTNQHRDSNYGRSAGRMYAVSINQATDTENPIDNAVGYGKGQLVLQMLEDQIGKPAMLDSVHRFFADHVDGEAADWPDFIAAVKKSVKDDISWFFDQWFDRPGAPICKIEDVKYANGVVTGKIVQEGKPYRMRVTVAAESPTDRATETMDASGPETTFSFRCMVAPITVTLDPGGNILMQGGKVTREGSPFVWKF